MASRRQVLRRLFEKGQVTDTDTSDLAPDMAEALRDVVWTGNGDLAKRGGMLYATGANPIDANTDTLLGVFLYPTESTTVPGQYTYRLIVTDTYGRVGVLTGYTYTNGTANASTTSVALEPLLAAYPVMMWQDELIFTRFDSSRNRMTYRWGGSTATEDATPSGTVAVTTDSDVVTGTSTAFTSEVTAGQYLNVTDSTTGLEYCFKVDFVESDTLLQISGKAQVTVSGNYTVTNFGYPNISSLVTDRGTVTTSGTTATGKATDWTGGLDEVIANHLGVSWLAGTAATTRYGITTLTDDNTLTLAGSAALTNSNYVIGMPLAGHIVAAHSGRLWIAGVPWAPNRLQVTPINHNLSDVFNGVDSPTTDPDNAAVIESVDIPDDKSPGYITAIASGNDPGPLVVCRDRDAYIVYGEWPSIQVTKLGSDIGCSDWRGITFHGRAFYWAGLEGVFTYTPGGGVRNLTEGRIYREWKAAIGDDTVTKMVVEVVSQVLFVSVTTTAGSFGYMFDLERGAWSQLTDVAWNAGTEVVVEGKGRDVFVTETTTNRVVSLRSVTDPTLAGASNSLQGSFLARSGRMLLGQAGDLGRVVDAKVTYRLTGSSSPAFTVKFGTTSLDTAGTVSTTTSGTAYATQRFFPGSTQMGNQVRDVQVEFAESAGTITRLELNEFSWVARLRRPRA